MIRPRKCLWAAVVITLTPVYLLMRTYVREIQPRSYTHIGSNEASYVYSSVRNLHTTIPNDAHSNGFTLFDNIYLRGGTLYVVTSNRSLFPDTPSIISAPHERGKGLNVEPTDAHMKFIHPSEMESELGDTSWFIRKEGLSLLVYDPPQFMAHYYHWWGEIVLGFWRVYSRLSAGDEPLPMPKHIFLPFASNSEWRDRANVNGPLVHAGFPDATLENSDYWQDLIIINRTVAFDRVMLTSRSSAHTHPYNLKWFKMIAGTMEVTVPDRFFERLRTQIVHGVLGYLPHLDYHGIVVSPPSAVSAKPIVTYISRQLGPRHLIQEDHENLVVSLKELEALGLCEAHIHAMETLSLAQQMALISRSTIIIGVHGNGLTHQLWMPPTSRSAVLEIMIPGGYVFDYELLARNMGHKHIAIWNDTYATFEKGTYHKGVNIPQGFHGKTIPVHGPAVAEIIRRRLDGTLR